MASPVAVRQPLAQRTINTTFYSTATPIISTTTTTTIKPIAGQKRTHSQIHGQENNHNNVQQQILSAATFKAPTFPSSRQKQTTLQQPSPSKKTLVHVKPINQAQQPQQSQFKQPSTKSVNVSAISRQRQQTHDPGANGEHDEEMTQWRKSMRRTMATSTFYFDGLDEGIKDHATRFLSRNGGVRNPCPNDNINDCRKSHNSFRIQWILLSHFENHLLSQDIRHVMSQKRNH
jgi:hypothetical protein